MTKLDIYTIPPECAFADYLARGLLELADYDQSKLSSFTVLLPNRRGVVALREALLRLLGSQVMLLPIMQPLGDADEEAVTFKAQGLGHTVQTLSPAIPMKHRHLILTRWLKQTPLLAASPSYAQAWRLAGELAHLIDNIDTYDIDKKSFDTLVPEHLASHWQLTLDLLNTAFEFWSGQLHSLGYINPSARRNQLLDMMGQVWATNPPKGRVFVAGTTGSIPATRKLLKHLKAVQDFSLILPGFDHEMDQETWDALGPTHPQYMMKKLCDYLRVKRDETMLWPSCSVVDSADFRVKEARTSLVRDALLPAKRTDIWQNLQNDINAQTVNDDLGSFASVRKIEAPSRRLEAAATALIMREVLNTPSRTAALVTPDRVLARYVREELTVWDIDIDDTGGDQALHSLPGRLLSLISRAVSEAFSPTNLLALLKHPLVALGRSRSEFLKFVRRLDHDVLRGPRPPSGLQGLVARAQQVADQIQHMTAKQRQRTLGFSQNDAELCRDISRLMEPMQKLLDNDNDLKLLLIAHINAAEALACVSGQTNTPMIDDLGDPDNQQGAEHIWAHEAGQALSDALAPLIEHGSTLTNISAESYDALFGELLQDVIVRPVWKKHPRLFIWGAIEARLQTADVMILGGLNEGTWPPEPKPDTWMNNEMRKAVGLPALEERIGQSAHDFCQAMGADQAFLTHSLKIDGSPTVPSRWLFRLEALAARSIPSASHYLRWAKDRNKPERITPIKPPAPKPPVSSRPCELSVTQVQTWMCDPYALYGQKILGLSKLEDIDTRPNASHKGIMLHKVLELFMKLDKSERSGADAKAKLMAIGTEVFQDLATQPTVHAFWWPRFERVAEWFIDHEAERQKFYRFLGGEVWGHAKLSGTDFTLKAQADRLDKNLLTGAIAILDYKTGNIPSAKKMALGYAPQLPLEGLLIKLGAFKGLGTLAVGELIFWEIKGDQKIHAMHQKHLSTRNKAYQRTVGELIDGAEQGLRGLIQTFTDPNTPYLSQPNPDKDAAGYGDYDHLARVGEWSLEENEDSYDPEGAMHNA